MELLIFSDNTRLIKRLEAFTRRSKLTVTSFSVEVMKKKIPTQKKPIVVYLDISGLPEYEKEIRYLSKGEGVFFGIIDTKGKVKDYGQLISDGAVDYIGKSALETAFTTKRFQKVIQYIRQYRRDYDERKKPEQSKKKSRYIISPQGWKGITSGREYAFSIMFIEFDGENEMEKKYGRKNLKRAITTFAKFIERNVTPFDGRIWIWSGVGGVVLFPFNGSDCLSVLCGFRIMLNKYIHDVEESLFPNFISFRIALHLGNLLYFTEDTGEIISDTINSLFHLGRKFAEPDNFYVTDDVMTFTPEKIKRYFVPAGTYENRAIFRMKRPVFIVK
ncbi:MAG: hypothetical protein JW881_02695 [Spirochaetales bacterium]|nr:hypothetical protein [Spirochaetales bacterium]